MEILARTVPGAAAIAVALAVPLAWPAGPAAASGSRAVVNAGSCSHHGTFRLVAKHDDTAIEIEYQVDTNVAGQRFKVRLTDNGAVIAKRTETTARPSGSFTIARRTGNRAGVDTIRARAVAGSNVCGGIVRV